MPRPGRNRRARPITVPADKALPGETTPGGLAVPAAGSVEIWWTPTSAAASGWGLLDPGERERAREFLVEHARRTFVTSRTAQRSVLAKYLGVPPESVAIDRTCPFCGASHGRPVVRGAAADFSVSHTTDWVAIAVTGTGLVGLDAEALDPRFADAIAAAGLSPAEAREWAALTHDDRTTWALRCWTRKEAAVKLTGHGLAIDLRLLNVTDDVVAVAGSVAGWPPAPIFVNDVAAPAGHLAAVATTVPLRSVRMLHAAIDPGCAGSEQAVRELASEATAEGTP